MAIIKITVDGANAEATLNRLQKEFKETDVAMEDTEKSNESLNKSIGKSSKEYDDLSKSVDGTSKSLKTLAAGGYFVAGSLGVMKQGLKYALATMTVFTGYTLYTTNKLDEFRGASERLGTELTEAKASFDAFTTVMMKPVYDAFIAGTKEVNRLVGEQAPKALEAMAEGIKTMAKIGIDAMAWLLKAIAEVVAAIMKIPYWLDQALGAVGTFWQSIKESAYEMGAGTIFGHTQAAEGIAAARAEMAKYKEETAAAAAAIANINAKTDIFKAGVDGLSTKLKTVVDKSKPLDFKNTKKDFLKMGAEEVKIAKKVAKDKVKAVKKIADKGAKEAAKAAADALKAQVAEYNNILGGFASSFDNMFHSILDGDIVGGFKSMFDDIMHTAAEPFITQLSNMMADGLMKMLLSEEAYTAMSIALST
ncbi:MAG: hypothetical protein J7L21_04640, partial [Sulfurimonas sp.]|nr:hypothetical protein [Sulfurimonas sp.]